MLTTTISRVPQRASGHRDVAFCNGPCDWCEAEMLVRGDRYQRAGHKMLARIMAQAPVGR